MILSQLSAFYVSRILNHDGVQRKIPLYTVDRYLSF